jgi:hypothetical protein
MPRKPSETITQRVNTKMAKTTEESNRALVLEAIDSPFNKRDYKAAERFVGRRVQARCAR